MPVITACIHMQVIKAMQSAPSEADLMRDTIDVLTNSSAPEHEVLLALGALQVLVEPIDNANGEHLLNIHLYHLSCCNLQANASISRGTA